MEKKTSKTLPQPGNPAKMRTITLEEHFGTPSFMEGPGGHLKGGPAANASPQAVAAAAKRMQRVLDIGDGRVAEMDAAGTSN